MTSIVSYVLCPRVTDPGDDLPEVFQYHSDTEETTFSNNTCEICISQNLFSLYEDYHSILKANFMSGKNKQTKKIRNPSEREAFNKFFYIPPK